MLKDEKCNVNDEEGYTADTSSHFVGARQDDGLTLSVTAASAPTMKKNKLSQHLKSELYLTCQVLVSVSAPLIVALATI